MEEQIKTITTEVESKLNTTQSRLDKVQKQITKERQSFQSQLAEAKETTRQITVERDELLSKIETLNNVNSCIASALSIYQHVCSSYFMHTSGSTLV